LGEASASKAWGEDIQQKKKMKCHCETHISVEAKEKGKDWIPCVGHGEECPCTKRIEQEKHEAKKQA